MSFLIRAACHEFRNIQLAFPAYSRSLATTVSSQISEFVRFYYTTSKPLSRDYSVTSVYPGTAIDQGKPLYIELHESTNKVKTEKVFIHTLESTLRSFDILEIGSTLSKNWSLLQDYLLKYHSYKLPELKQEDSFENIRPLLKLVSRPLIKGIYTLNESELSDYIFTTTEYYWKRAGVGVPFTRVDKRETTDLSKMQETQTQCPYTEALPERLENLSEMDQKVQFYSLNGEKDATVAIFLAIPHIDENTLLYEMGCWNGQNILNLLFYASLKGRLPKYCIGSDVNYIALTMAQFVSSLLSIVEPFVQFHLSNALEPLDPKCLDIKFDKQVRVALRLIPVLEPDRAKIFLLKTRECLKREKDVLIVSYALPNSKAYKEKLSNARDSDQSQVTKEEFSEKGVDVFFEKGSPKEKLPLYLKDHRVVNTYYTVDAFSSLVQECGFEIKHAITVRDEGNEMGVALLLPN